MGSRCIVFFWAPGHVGILRNEEAEMAKQLPQQSVAQPMNVRKHDMNSSADVWKDLLEMRNFSK